MKSNTRTKPDASTAFRLPRGILATVDQYCSQQDLTRSQLYRRSVMEYLKNQQVDLSEPSPEEPKLTWSEALYKRVGR